MKSIITKILGVITLLISFYFIFENIDVSFFEKIKVIRSIKILLFSFISIFFVMMCILIESINFRNIIYKISYIKIPIFNIYSISSKSNISKYIPGNISQYLIRNVLIKKFNISHNKIVYSSLLETFFTVFISFFWTNIFIIIGFLKLPEFFLFDILKFKNGFFLIIFLIVLISLMIFFKKKIIRLIKSFDFYKNVKIIFQTFSFSFIVFSITNILFAFSFLFGYIILFGINLSLNDVLYIFSVVTSAGLIGMITPGLPAGIGVREGVLLLFLGPQFGNEITIIIAFIHRLICIASDILTLIFSFLISKFFIKNKLKSNI